jgi:hypothetical protein
VQRHSRPHAFQYADIIKGIQVEDMSMQGRITSKGAFWTNSISEEADRGRD